MTAIGVDTHKATLAACAVDPLGTPIAEATFANDLAGHRAFIGWARSRAPEATIGIEGSSSYGAPSLGRPRKRACASAKCRRT
jgi:transposase